MTIWGLFLLAALVMKRWPETALARWLHRTMIVQPLNALGGLKRQHLILLLVAAPLMFSFAEIGMPHLAMAAAIDVSLYVDLLITATTLAALDRSRGTWTAFTARLPRLRRANPRPRRRRSSTSVARKPAANDDDGHGVFARAA